MPSRNWSSSQPKFLFLGSILPVAVVPGVSLSCENIYACKEEERFVCDCLARSPRLFLCILEYINILGYPLYFKVIALHFIIQVQEVKGMATYAPCLEVGEKLL